MISENELKKERDYLKTVLYILNKKLESNKDRFAKTEKSIEGQLKYIWENNLLLQNEAEYYILQDNVQREQAENYDMKNVIGAHERMIDSAYFARVDFDDGDEVLPVYIGIASLIDGTSFYVYDWRAPISSLFYEYELGDAQYKLPNGNTIKGNVILKRQYKIEGDKIVEIFDTELQIIDNILQKMLSGNVTDRMKNIVKSIQKEQNEIIRNNDVDILAVQGPAGSGKTSVALHRIAYVLYNEKETIKNSNIIIISPNDIFSSYISNVLPEIGEDNVYQTTFKDYVKAFATEYKVKGDMADIYEELFTNTSSKKSVKFNSIKLKFSPAYIRMLEKIIDQNRDEILGLNDVVADNKVLIESGFLQKYADSLDRSISMEDQAKLVAQKINSHLEIKLNKDKKLKNRIMKGIELKISKLRAKPYYSNSLFESQDKFVQLAESVFNELGTEKSSRFTIKQLKDIYDYTKALIIKDTLPYEDITGYLYMKGKICGFNNQVNIKHVVIDEAQDYTLMQYNILAKVFQSAKFTLLGDTNQGIMPFAQHRGYDSILNTLAHDRARAKTDLQYLSKTYRSTFEINTFAKGLLKDKIGYNQVERHGDHVEIIQDIVDIKSSRIIKDAIKMKSKYPTVAIIVKTAEDMQRVKKAIEGTQSYNEFLFVDKDTENFVSNKIVVIPSYISKGLEFDAVLIFEANKTNYPEELSNLFYVICTRALHKLNIYYTEELCDVIR